LSKVKNEIVVRSINRLHLKIGVFKIDCYYG
jgi:hypothetical protein